MIRVSCFIQKTVDSKIYYVVKMHNIFSCNILSLASAYIKYTERLTEWLKIKTKYFEKIDIGFMRIYTCINFTAMG